MSRFIVVADSHIRLPDDGGAEYPSNALLADRNRWVVALCNRLRPDFVIHLGDVVHPLPTEPGHEQAVALAAGIYEELEAPIHFVPGNHDIGDKPDSLVAVPAVADAHYEVFERYWGRPFGSFDHGDGHFVLVDTPVLGSGLEREQALREWLERDLEAAAAKRVFVFTHYPPFVTEAEEAEHYDNLAPEPRGWLLGLCRRYGVEAVFSGHVHNHLVNRHEGTDFHVLPATGFVRPDYSETAAIAPERESGRNEPAKLGIYVVELGDADHRVRPVRTFGAVAGTGPIDPEVLAGGGWACPVGVTFRHGWAALHDLPAEGLDEFRRKTVRDDYSLLALREARIDRVRIPVGDVLAEPGRRRVAGLAAQGIRFTVFSAGAPDPATRAAIEALAGLIERWEVILPPEQWDLLPAGSPVPVAAAPIVPIGGPDHHFVAHGFDPGDPLPDLPCEEMVFRADWPDPIAPAFAGAAASAASAGKQAVVVVRSPRAAEAEVFDDDDAVAAWAVAAVRAARQHPGVEVFLDTFMDHDRGYYRRHGLIDRRSDPRPALYALIEASAGRPDGS